MIQRRGNKESTEGLSPLESLDLDGIHSFPQLLEAMKETAFRR